MRSFTAVITIAMFAGCSDLPSQATRDAAKARDQAEAYHNPVDDKTYIAPGGWETFEPASPRPDQPGRKVKTELLRLLTSQADTAARTSAEQVAEFVHEAERLAEVSFAMAGEPCRITAQFTCTPAGHEVKLAHEGDAPQELLQQYYDALTAAKKLPVTEGEVSFQLVLAVSP